MEGTGTSVAPTPQTQEQSQQAPVVDPARQELDRLMTQQLTARTPAEQNNNQPQPDSQQDAPDGTGARNHGRVGGIVCAETRPG